MTMTRVGEVFKPRGNVGLASVVAAIAQSKAPPGQAKKAGSEMPNLAFDLGHGPFSDPTIRRPRAINHPPLVAPPGAVPVNAGVRPNRRADPLRRAWTWQA